MEVHLVDGTYELFRYHHAPRNDDPERGAVRGVLRSLMGLLEDGATHVGVATDHVIESFRNDLWPSYKSSVGMPGDLLSQFIPLEEALRALGLVVWAMVEVEADDAIASAALMAAADPRVERILVATPDKDLAQCVVDDRVVQWDRMRNVIRNEAAVQERFGVPPAAIPDWLALVGDSADGYPGLPGFGAKSAAVVLSRHGTIDAIPDDPAQWDVELRGVDRLAATLREGRTDALLFRRLAQLRTDVDVGTVDDLEWRGPTDHLAELAGWAGAPELVERARELSRRRLAHR